MNQAQFYQWRDEIQQHLGLSKPQSMGLALLSLGIVWAERSTLSKVGERLAAQWGSMTSIERRLQRVVSNPGLDMVQTSKAWTKWVVSQMDSEEVVLLVDETKLGEHLCVMMVGLAYASRCIPLAWRCYQSEDYPAEGQVKLISKLLRLVKVGLPADYRPVVEADRGSGTSPGLVRVVRRLGWRFLFRVQSSTKICTADGQEYCLGEQASGWSATGRVFKKRGIYPPVPLSIAKHPIPKVGALSPMTLNCLPNIMLCVPGKSRVLRI